MFLTSAISINQSEQSVTTTPYITHFYAEVPYVLFIQVLYKSNEARRTRGKLDTIGMKRICKYP